MADDIPPLVDPSSMMAGHTPVIPFGVSWMQQPPPQMGGTPMQPTHLPPGWGGFNAQWMQPQPMLTPMFANQSPFPMNSPAVTQVPIPTGTVATGNDDWIRNSRPGWEESESSSPSSDLVRRTPSKRSRTPFSDGSSPSSLSSDISRGKSFSRAVREEDKRPPREWRSDFTMARTSSLGAALGSIFNIKRPKSASRRSSISIPKFTMHPYIRYTSSSSMFLDLRRKPETVRFRELGRPTDLWDFSRFACEPPLTSLTIYSPHYPWYIEVKSENPVGVTLYELFYHIYCSMMTPISSPDYWNNEVDERTREEIKNAWIFRCGDSSEERQLGIKRVDFLMERAALEGFAKGRDGMWEMKVKRL